MRCLLVLSALLVFVPSLAAQALPWRRRVEQRLQQQDRLIAQLLQQQRGPQTAPPAPIIVLPSPRQELPIPGEPKQQVPIGGAPKQDLPAPGEPKQGLPGEGKPQQPLPPQGLPRQELPVMPPASSPQRYTIIVRAIHYRTR